MMNNYFIILASGQSKRFNSNTPKQFITYKNKALFGHSLDKDLINLKGKTVEKLGLIGKEKAIACEVICSISQ